MGQTILYWIRGPGSPGTCFLLRYWTWTGMATVLGGPAPGCGRSGPGRATVEIRRDVEWGVACTRVRVDDEGARSPATSSRHGADHRRRVTLRDGPGAGHGAVRELAEVEAGVHACSVDEIHFHEVGAVDTLVDIVGAFALVEALGIDSVMVGPIPVGGGTVEIAHGRMGVPAPATARLLEGYELVGGPEMRELTTPTGALLVRQLGAGGGAMPRDEAREGGLRRWFDEAREGPQHAAGDAWHRGRPAEHRRGGRGWARRGGGVGDQPGRCDA